MLTCVVISCVQQPLNDEAQSEVSAAILRQYPAVLPAYFAAFPLSMEPRPSSKWLQAISYVIDILKRSAIHIDEATLPSTVGVLNTTATGLELAGDGDAVPANQMDSSAPAEPDTQSVVSSALKFTMTGIQQTTVAPIAATAATADQAVSTQTAQDAEDINIGVLSLALPSTATKAAFTKGLLHKNKYVLHQSRALCYTTMYSDSYISHVYLTLYGLNFCLLQSGGILNVLAAPKRLGTCCIYHGSAADHITGGRYRIDIWPAIDFA